MRRYREELDAMFGSASQLAEGLGYGLAWREQSVEWRRRLEAYCPTLMVYGLYNAGKSTLVNALLPEAQAPVGDAPCTSRVETYRFGEYELHDTPGVDAPREHEQVSEEQLARAHVVAFVLSTAGTFDEKATIRKLADLVMSRKPLVIVLHAKGGLDIGSPEVRGMQRAVVMHLERVTGRPELVAAVPFLLVNARSAIRGREENKPLLLEASGVPQLQQTLLDTLLRTTGAALLLPAVNQLDGLLADLRGRLARHLDTDEAGVFEAARARIERARHDFVQYLVGEVKACRPGLVQDFMLAAQNGQPLDEAVHRYSVRVGDIASTQATLVAEELSLAFHVAETAVPSVVARSMSLAVPASAGPMAPPSSMNTAVFRQVLESDAFKQLLHGGLKNLHGTSIPGMGGLAKGGADKWAAGAAKGVGAALQLALVAVEVVQASKAQREAEQAALDERRRLHQAAEQAADDYQREILRALPSYGRAVFGDLEARFADQARDASAVSEAHHEALGRVDGWREALEDVRAGILAAGAAGA